MDGNAQVRAEEHSDTHTDIQTHGNICKPHINSTQHWNWNIAINLEEKKQTRTSNTRKKRVNGNEKNKVKSKSGTHGTYWLRNIAHIMTFLNAWNGFDFKPIYFNEGDNNYTRTRTSHTHAFALLTFSIQSTHTPQLLLLLVEPCNCSNSLFYILFRDYGGSWMAFISCISLLWVWMCVCAPLQDWARRKKVNGIISTTAATTKREKRGRSYKLFSIPMVRNLVQNQSNQYATTVVPSETLIYIIFIQNSAWTIQKADARVTVD